MGESTKPLAGRVAIVTGGGRDIGRAVAERLAKDGAQVAINYFNSDSGAASAVEKIEASGGRAFAMKGDMTSDTDVAALVDRTCAPFGDKIHVAVHVTGGLLSRQTIRAMEYDPWKRVMDPNM